MLKVRKDPHGKRAARAPGPSELERSWAAIEKARNQSKGQFLEKLRANSGYIRFTGIDGFDAGRRHRFEESCWRHRCFALRNELKGARAKHALARLTELCRALGDLCWVPEQLVSSLDSLQGELQHLASKGRRGRPKDTIARAFRRNMHNFVPPAQLSQRTARSLSREETDEILGELLEVVCGRKASAASITRMRMRERSATTKGQDL